MYFVLCHKDTALQNTTTRVTDGMNGNVEQAVYENLGASLLDDSNLSDHILFLKKKIDGFADEFAVRTFFLYFVQESL